MRKHGWQLPYHPLQVVAMAVFLALGFAFYVFFAPFVGKKLYQFILMGIYTPLLICSFGLYIWCAVVDPADPGVFRSKKYLNIPNTGKHAKLKESTSSFRNPNAAASQEKASDKGEIVIKSGAECNKKNSSSNSSNQVAVAVLALLPCVYICKLHDESSDQQSEDGMFYCSLCEVEVFKYSKHCQVCDKCVDHFDHHCRWLNNCIGKQNYRKFFTLMVSALLLLVLEWSTGILVLILCFLERKQFASDISSKLGSSFTVVPYVIVVAVCTILAMVATLPLAQLFFFHILLIKKGISTYDYIIALREQEQQAAGGHHSPQMSPITSFTGLSSTSSFNALNRVAWCTPPRLFVEDQFDVVPPDNRSVSSLGKRTTSGEQMKKKNPAPVKISPWTLARLNADDVSKAATEARKKSKIMRPMARHEPSYAHETDSSLGSSSRQMTTLWPEGGEQCEGGRLRLPLEPLSKLPSLGNLQSDRDHRTTTGMSSAFQPNRAILGLPGIVPSSPESSLDSPDLHHVGVSSSGAEEARTFVRLSSAAAATASEKDIPLSRSTSDGYDASGGEDSDRVPTRIVHRSSDWRSLPFGSETSRRNLVKWAAAASNQRMH